MNAMLVPATDALADGRGSVRPAARIVNGVRTYRVGGTEVRALDDGIAASIHPARRGARLNVLRAIAAE